MTDISRPASSTGGACPLTNSHTSPRITIRRTHPRHLHIRLHHRRETARARIRLSRATTGRAGISATAVGPGNHCGSGGCVTGQITVEVAGGRPVLVVSAR